MEYWQIVKAFEEGKTITLSSDCFYQKEDNSIFELFDGLKENDINKVKILPTKEERAEEIFNEIIALEKGYKCEKAIELIKNLL